MGREEHPWNCHIRSIYGDALDNDPGISESIPSISLDKLVMYLLYIDSTLGQSLTPVNAEKHSSGSRAIAQSTLPISGPPLRAKSLAGIPAMASHQIAIAKASFSAGLLRPDPTSVPRDDIAAFHTCLERAVSHCSPANIQV